MVLPRTITVRIIARIFVNLETGDWRLGIGDRGFGIGDLG